MTLEKYNGCVCMMKSIFLLNQLSLENLWERVTDLRFKSYVENVNGKLDCIWVSLYLQREEGFHLTTRKLIFNQGQQTWEFIMQMCQYNFFSYKDL